MKRILTLLLVAVLVLSMLAMLACTETPDPGKDPGTDSGNTGTNNGNDDNNGNENDDQESSRYDVADSLPAKGEIDYGTQFNITYSRDNILNTFWVGEQTGGSVDNAVYAAIAKTEERFGVTIVATASGFGDKEHVDQIRNQIGSGKTGFDIARVHDAQGGNLSLEGVFVNLYDVEELDFSKPWWSDKTIESLTYMDQLYLISSSMSYNALSGAKSVFFNKDMMDDWGRDYPYQLVEDELWTLEELIIQSADVYEEGDDGEEGKSLDDTYGLVIDQTLYFIEDTFGIQMVAKDEDGELILTDGSDGRIYDLAEMLYDISFDQDGGHLIPRADAQKIFGEGRAMYTFGSLGDAVSVYAGYEVNYGIIPVPKLEADDEGYVAAHSDFFFVIPTTCTDTSYVGTIVESMSAEGYRTVTPVYFEKVLKDRYAKDPESSAMVELIQDSMMLGFDYVYGQEKWLSHSLYHMLTQNHSKDVASYLQTNQPAAEDRFNLIVEKFTAMKNAQ